MRAVNATRLLALMCLASNLSLVGCQTPGHLAQAPGMFDQPPSQAMASPQMQPAHGPYAAPTHPNAMMAAAPGPAAVPMMGPPPQIHQAMAHASHAHGAACPHCNPTNPLSKPIEIFGMSSADYRNVQPASYTQDGPVVQDPTLQPQGIPHFSPHALPPVNPHAFIPPNIPHTTVTPADEFINDGGDEGIGAAVDDDWTVRGLDIEDTVGHFDTLDGRRLIEPSNRVHIYAPRFGSVRQTYGVSSDTNVSGIAAAAGEVGLEQFEEVDAATTTLQQLQPRGQVGSKSASTYRDRTRGVGLENRVSSSAFNNRFSAFEDLSLIKTGTYDQNEKARLSESLEAAESWGRIDAAQNVVDNLTVDGLGTGLPAAETVSVKEKESKPELRLVKLASKADALPGEVIEFTIRFDNVGNETIGNVTILDHLSPRLEVIDGSAECSLDAEFFVTEQNQTSQIFRAEIIDPLPANQGGIVRFKCRVR